MDDTLVKFLLAILFVFIIVIILYFATTDQLLKRSVATTGSTKDPSAQSNRLYTYIFSIIVPLVGIMLYLKEELIDAGIAAGFYIAVFLGICLAGFVITVIYNYLPEGSSSLIFVNFLIFLVILLILFVGLAIIYNMGYDYFSKQTGKTAFYLQLIFYIPCLISDAIKYIFNDFRTTSNMIFALFVAEILLILAYIYGPNTLTMILTQNSRVLLPDYRPLNAFNTIAQANMFQVKSPTDAKSKRAGAADDNDSPVCADIYGVSLDNPAVADKGDYKDNPRKPSLKGIPDPQHVSTGPNDPSNNLCKYNPDMVMDPYMAVKCSKITLDDLKTTYGSQTLYDTVANKMRDDYANKLKQSQNTLYNLNYAISFWTFVNYKPEIFRSPHELNVLNYSNPANDYKGFGGNPKITFLNDEYNVYFSNHPKCQSIGKYESGCMYKVRLQNQKWNNFVLNYYSDHVDLFINGILEKTYQFSDNKPIYSDSDQVNVGELNGAYGSICNVVYYTVPLTQPQIATYYNILSVRNPPVIQG